MLKDLKRLSPLADYRRSELYTASPTSCRLLSIHDGCVPPPPRMPNTPSGAPRGQGIPPKRYPPQPTPTHQTPPFFPRAVRRFSVAATLEVSTYVDRSETSRKGRPCPRFYSFCFLTNPGRDDTRQDPSQEEPCAFHSTNLA